MMHGIGRFGLKTINADTVELQPPLDKIVKSGMRCAGRPFRHGAVGGAGPHQPRSGGCGGTYARRGQDRFACSNHVLANGCDNARTIAREVLEARVLTGLRDHMMTPDMAAEAMRAYTQETNRLNRERRQSEDATRRELAETVKAIAEIVRVIEQGGYHRALSTRLTELETKQDGLTACLSDVPSAMPDIHPNIAETYRRRIERLTAALDHPDDALEAADALREVIDRIVVTPGKSRGDYSITPARRAWHDPRLDRPQRKTRLQAQP